MRYIHASAAVIAVVGLALAFWFGRSALLLAFAGILLAIAFHSAAGAVSRLTGLRGGWSLAVALLVIAGIIAGLCVLVAPRIGDQIDELQAQIPQAWHGAEQRLSQTEWGRTIVSDLSGSKLFSRTEHPLSSVFSAFSSTVAVLGTLIIVFFLGLYFAADPRLYRSGFLQLVPKNHQDRAKQVLDELGQRLQRWLMGKFALMLFVGVATAIGLWILGSPLIITLALLAALLDFIPNFGPVLSAIPAMLLALAQGPEQMVWVGALYLGVQIVESYILQPLVQQQAVSLPPSVTLVSQILAAILLGPLGVILATPLTVAGITLVQMLYVQDFLHNDRHHSATEPSS